MLATLVSLAAAFLVFLLIRQRRSTRTLEARALGAAPLRIDGTHGVDASTWSPQRAKRRLAEFENAGPGYALPVRTGFDEMGIPSCEGSVYVALFPLDRFDDLLDFQLFQRFASSIHQDLIRFGELDMDSFYPEAADALLDRFSRGVEQVSARPLADEMTEVLAALRLPPHLRWVSALSFDAWDVHADADGVELTARTTEGYLTLFVVDG